MLDRIISGGQSGADQAALRTARAMGVPTGGTAPRGWLAEVLVEDEHGPIRWKASPCPWLADFGLVECERPGYKARTARNVRDADATLWFADWHTPGATATLGSCRALYRPFDHDGPGSIARHTWLRPPRMSS
jgi:hypothetical protein